jgi:hypothetical protein
MKPTQPASLNAPSHTVLMVDGHGRIRTIPKFQQKLRLGIAALVGALLIAGVAGWLYIDGLQTRRALQDQVASLRAEVAAAEHQKELLLARAVRAESRTAPDARPRTPAAATAPAAAPPVEDRPPAPTPVVKSEPAQSAEPPAAPPKEVKPEPVVSVALEDLKVSYQESEKSLATAFVIRNTGTVQAQGRAVVVLSSKDDDAAPRLSLPAVPLQNDRPRGNRGRRFSITRFMRLSLQRKVAEPGLRFDAADVYVFDMQGKLLQEKSFAVAVSIPAAAPAAPAPAVRPENPAADQPVASPAANSILAIPPNNGQEPQGGQED